VKGKVKELSGEMRVSGGVKELSGEMYGRWSIRPAPAMRLVEPPHDFEKPIVRPRMKYPVIACRSEARLWAQGADVFDGWRVAQATAEFAHDEVGCGLWVVPGGDVGRECVEIPAEAGVCELGGEVVA
jgi:hypothetical protein